MPELKGLIIDIYNSLLIGLLTSFCYFSYYSFIIISIQINQVWRSVRQIYHHDLFFRPFLTKEYKGYCTFPPYLFYGFFTALISCQYEI